jgi:hypothetical protein
MNVGQQTKARFSWLSLAFLGLAVFVFTWGLQYKLSLYDPPQAISHRIPEAKLLSKKEQASETNGPLLDNSKAPARTQLRVFPGIFLLIALALNPFRVPVSLRRDRNEQLKQRDARFACLNAFFFRPPPAFA